MSNLDARLAYCMIVDQRAIRRRARRLGKGGRRDEGDPRWGSLERDLARCEARYRARREAAPVPRIPKDLAIAAHASEVVEAIREHPVVIVSGDTGSGKSTQLPKLCLLAGRGLAGQIAHTQPRRVAARGIARRIASELGESLGGSVGFKVRFDAQVRHESYIKVVTDGILLAELGRDRELSAYDTIIVDEAHERSLNIDFLLGHLKHLLRRRRDLKVVISSATLDEARFAAFFNDAPLVRVQGRSHPVEIRYRPPGEDADLATSVHGAIDELAGIGAGDVLVFLSGEREIADVSARLRRGVGHRFQVLPLYARLPMGQQDRIFEAHDRPRIILATNVAETSLTVPGVRYVVDAGYERVSRRSPGSAVQRLPVERISRASARQRAGRCGREQPGICIRLYDEHTFDSLAEHSQPEILRTELASVLLRMRALGVRKVSSFQFLDPPDRRNVNDGLRLLRELGALDAHDALSALGRQLARFPVDPRIARMLLEAGELGCVKEVLVIASGLAVGDPRERQPGRKEPLPQHLVFDDERSDFLRLTRIWDHLHPVAGRGRTRELKELCRHRRLSFPRVQEWRELHLQLSLIAREMDLHPAAEDASFARIHRALLSGLLRNVGVRVGERDYQGIRGNSFRLSRASAQRDSRPRWVLAAELIDAGQAFAHTVARIRAEWVERAAGDLLRRSHYEAWWDPVRGEPMVNEQTALYSLTVTARRRVRFAPVSRSGAREVFIRGALVDGRFDSPAAVIPGNRGLLGERHHRQDRLRQPDPAISEERLFQFFDGRLPESVCDAASFELWRRRDGEAVNDLSLTGYLANEAVPGGDEELAFPEQWVTADARLPLSYRFRPGEDDDGITLKVPRRALSRLDPRAFEWVVPGMLGQKVLELLRALPKSVRRRLGPAASVAAQFVAAHPSPEGSLLQSLARFLALRFGVDVDEQAWDPRRLATRLPAHLRVRFQVVDEEGLTVGTSRDLESLRERHAGGHHHDVPAAREPGLAGRRYRCWPDVRLPHRVESSVDGVGLTLYPVVNDCGDGVCVEQVDGEQRARALHLAGLLRLTRLDGRLGRRRPIRELRDGQQLVLMHALLPAPPPELAALSSADPDADVLEAVLDRAVADVCFPDGGWDVRDASDFEQRVRLLDGKLSGAMTEVAEKVMALLRGQRELISRLLGEWPAAWADNLDDVREQLDWMLHRGFVAGTPPMARKHLSRYLEGIRRRLDKLSLGGARDGEKLALVRPPWERFVARARSHQQQGRRDAGLVRYRWLLEEYRISVFAQELGTRERVSRQRLDDLWDRIPP